MGVTVAIPASVVEGVSRHDLADEFKDLAAQAEPGLRRFVGDAPPKGPLSVKIDGPVDDPLQGMIYSLTLAGPFDDADLPPDCDAYLAFNGPARAPEPIGYVETEGDGS